MSKSEYKVIGLMSGTSIDGLDIAFSHYSIENGNWSYELINSRNVDYSVEMKIRLKNSVNLPGLELQLLNNEYGRWLGEQVKKFVDDHRINPDFVASHGHTVFHQIDKKFTLQIGSGWELGNTCGITTVCDFRSLDVALGGQGAPLVPIGDHLLLSEYDFCLNLGGISNVSFILDGERVAFDIGVANMLLNHLCSQINLDFDDEGQIAKSGSLDQQLLEALNNLDYHRLTFPKSTGYEWFVDEIMPIVDTSTSSVKDKLHTSVHHIAELVKKALTHYAKPGSNMIITGGGAKNTFLIELLKKKLKPNINIIKPSPELISFKEAIVFGLMGVLRMRGETNCLKSVTGASRDSSCGIIFTA
ncbi:MAG: anhydro-N-acetylmuramic acid kinase [Cyclobacteriaceae bacterium]